MRQRPPANPVTITLDGEAVIAEAGEPVAASLLAAGHHTLARSPKYHRPRGPGCMRGACDGCLMRVDGEPNIMTCMIPAKEGMRIETQNQIGAGHLDVLRAADWFFPNGMNHHELLAGVFGLQSVMQSMARRIAGLGKLPDEAGETFSAARREVDALVIGSGPFGMAVAVALAGAGRSVEVVDDALEFGGAARALRSSEWAPLVAEFERAKEKGTIVFRQRTLAVSVYGDDVLLVDTRASVITAKDVVLATGAHDGVLAFEGNDLPGVMSARAGLLLAHRGVVLGQHPVVVISEGGGPFGESFAEWAKAQGHDVRVTRGKPLRAKGTSRVKQLVVSSVGGDGKGAGQEKFDADVVLIDAPRAPSFELAVQAGATTRPTDRGYIVEAEGGRIRNGFWAVGELVGEPIDLKRALAAARAVLHGEVA